MITVVTSLPEIALRTLLAGDRTGAEYLLRQLDPDELLDLAHAATELADLATPHHRCVVCGRWTPLDDREVPGRPALVGTAPPMRCTSCTAGERVDPP